MIDKALIGEWSGLATAFVAIVTMIIGEFRRRRSATVSETRKAVLSQTTLEGVEGQLKRLADSLENMNARQTEHEVECAGFRGRVEAEVEATRKAIESTDRRLETLSTQFNRVMPAADSFVEIVAPGRRRRAVVAAELAEETRR